MCQDLLDHNHNKYDENKSHLLQKKYVYMYICICTRLRCVSFKRMLQTKLSRRHLFRVSIQLLHIAFPSVRISERKKELTERATNRRMYS